MKDEIWKEIPGYDGIYMVSSLGRVKSIDRLINHWRGGKKRAKGKIIKQLEDIHGRPYVHLSKNNVVKKYRVHKLVAMAFLNHIPSGMDRVVDHINNDRKDNRLENLQVISVRENSIKESRGKSSHPGVDWYEPTKKWRARITIDGKRIFLGHFETEQEAAESYKKEIKKIAPCLHMRLK